MDRQSYGQLPKKAIHEMGERSLLFLLRAEAEKDEATQDS